VLWLFSLQGQALPFWHCPVFTYISKQYEQKHKMAALEGMLKSELHAFSNSSRAYHSTMPGCSVSLNHSVIKYLRT